MQVARGPGMLADMKPVPPDRLRDLVDALLEALDEGLDGPALAARAMLSRFHFDRLVRAGIGETPGAFRRRLLLERAAWRMQRRASVIEASIAFVDALCTPPVSFTFGSVIAHILTVSMQRRVSVIDALRELGIKDAETRDPIEVGALDRPLVLHGPLYAVRMSKPDAPK